MRFFVIAIAVAGLPIAETPLLADGAVQVSSESSIEAVVDFYVDQRLKEAAVEPAGQIDDANLLRRTMLDLVGRIPTAAEARTFVADENPDKRAQLVDRLIVSPGFARHQANELNAMLMRDTKKDLLKYLREVTAANRPWDEVFRDLITADTESGADLFLKSRVKDLDRLANDASVLFFGVNISCAQCHDHPLVAEWTQSHFFGMKSFFNRTYENGDFLGEHEYGLVSFKTTSGEQLTADLMFLTGTVLDEPEAKEPTDDEKKEMKKRLDELKKNKQPPPTPAYSRRDQLVRVALEDDENVYFSRSIVNRIWYRLFGRGLVAPVDQMHPENPASHPELLDWLAADLVRHEYDLRRLIRGLVLSQTYSRSSRMTGGKLPAEDLFAVAALRPLTPAQYATSLRLASMHPDWFPGPSDREPLENRIEQVESSARGFSQLIEQPTEDFQISVTEALLFSNNQRISSEFLRDSGDSLVGRLKSISDDRELVETATWNVLSRPPNAEEYDVLTQFVARYKEDRTRAARQLIWTLMTTNELRFNY